ncbi:MAG: DUF1697 domain-containing protein [Phycisphaerales bacterium]|nr:DUF1697 domain-containing protein [Phycisphaerales bacterium]
MALVVFLRGVNVGGNRTFRPSNLACELGRFDVENIGAAGTFVVRKPPSERLMRAAVCEHLPFDTEIFIRDGRDLIRLCESDPFDGEPSRSDAVRFVSVLAGTPSNSVALPFALPSSEN